MKKERWSCVHSGSGKQKNNSKLSKSNKNESDKAIKNFNQVTESGYHSWLMNSHTHTHTVASRISLLTFAL